jgi:ATP-binding cassette subfamily B (MDR/TAP) protein 1
MVPYSKLYSLGTKKEKTLLVIGWIAASITGLGLPSFVFLMGNIVDSFNPLTSNPDKMLHMISRIAYIFACVGAGIWVFAYIYFSLLLMASEKIASRTRVIYLEAILKQECAWYDTTNSQELAARVGKECLAI